MLLTGFLQTPGLLGHRPSWLEWNLLSPASSLLGLHPCPAIHACFLCFPSVPRPALCHRPRPGASHESTFLAFQPPPALLAEPHRAPFTARPSLPPFLRVGHHRPQAQPCSANTDNRWPWWGAGFQTPGELSLLSLGVSLLGVDAVALAPCARMIAYLPSTHSASS